MANYNKEIDFRNLPDAKKEKFRYKLPEIYSIWIMDYPVEFMENVYRDEVGLYNLSSVGKDGCVPISTKNKYIIVDLSKFDNPTFEDALRRIECDTASDELLIRQANVRDYISACSDAINESFEKGRDNRNNEIARDMLADNKPIDEIVKYSHLPKEKVLELQKTMAAKAGK